MSNAMQLFQQDGQLATRFQALAATGESMDELGEGIRQSYAIIGIKGGRFHVRYKGNDQMITQQLPDGQTVPVASIEVVILKANGFLNKQFYKGKYVEGSSAAPDCYSTDGKVPNAQVVNPVSNRCDLCPANQFGSRISDDGKKTKACRDTKKLAVVPTGDIMNEAMGGAMLFRVPPSALGDLSALADGMKQRGFPYNAISVRIGFDMTVSHPKPTFSAIRPLNDVEADQVFTMLQTDGVSRVLGDNDVVTELGAPQPAQAAFEQEPQATPAPVQPAPQAQAPEAPTQFVPPPLPPPVKGQRAFVIQPAGPGAAPPPPPSLGAFARDPTAPVPQAPAGAMAPEVRAARKPRTPAPAAPAPAPTFVQPAPAPAPQAPAAGPASSAMDADIANVLAGLSSFTAGAK